ncbi:hypothetical protein CTZ27_33270 [Streptomyces griseocarneus]|nr:hypothetical protein CTZ27_33270 [Streptomyces griseocarneus]
MPFPGNAKRGDVESIRVSLRKNGQYRSLVVREVRHGPLIVLAGNHTKMALAAEGFSDARCEIVECDDATARRINLADNRTGDLGTYDDGALAEILAGLHGEFDGSGYSDHDLDSLLATLAGPTWAEGQAAEMKADLVGETTESDAAQADGPAPSGRTLHRDIPIDAIFSMGRLSSISLAAYEMGFLPGIISTSLTSARDLAQRLPGVRLGFMDNEWHDYDHAAHVAAVAETRPKYATVRDAMTKQQCEDAGIEFLPLPRILEMAEEVAEHADHVIVIPKYDCLDKIPERYVIGFSVPTSYGGTPMPIEMLRGRRIHLLGGSWTKQRQYLALMGDDVVSFDNNHLLRVSEFGDFTYPDGTRGRLSGLSSKMPRTWQAAAILSLASIRTELNDLFAAKLTPVVGDGTAPTSGLSRAEDPDDEQDAA